MNRQGCCPPSPVLAATWLLGYASRSFRPSSRELRRAESVQAVHGHSRPTDFSRNAAGPRSANRDTDDETMSRCQLLPVSSTNVGHDWWTLKSADVGKGWCFCCPTPREIEAMVVEVADTLGAGTPSDSLTSRTAGCRTLRTSSPMCCPALVTRGRTIDPDPR